MSDNDKKRSQSADLNNPKHHPHITIPAHPHHRHEPLPWQQPKAPEEDCDAVCRVAAIQNSPSYREGDRDTEFLHRDDTRGLRLQIDYLKPELLLEQHGIDHTIVVFGSTRISEPATAKRNAELLQAALAAAPDDVELQRRAAVAERIVAKSHYYTIAQEFGQLVGTTCREARCLDKNSLDKNSLDKKSPEKNSSEKDEPRIVVMTGGGPGIMEAANRGAFDSGANTVGLNISLPHEQYPNPYVTPDLCFQFHYFAVRKLHFLLRARALVVFPGGYGTFDEMFEVLTLVQTRKIRPLPIVLVGETYWRRAFDVNFLVEEGVIDVEDRDLFWFAETAQDIWDGILLWHQVNGEPLLPASARDTPAP